MKTSILFGLLCVALAVADVWTHHYSPYTAALCLGAVGWLDGAIARYRLELWEQKR